MRTRHLCLALTTIVVLAGCAGRAAPALAPAAAAPTAAPVVVPALPPGTATAAPATSSPAAAAAATPMLPPAASPALATDTPLAAAQGTPAAYVDPSGQQGGSGAGTDRVTPGAAPARTAIAPAGQPTLPAPTSTAGSAPGATRTPPPPEQHPMSIVFERQRSYPGSEITFEQTLAPGANYARYIVSYRSDGFKIYALMTVPNGPKPATGWPVVLFNHGYIPPAQYVTTERYVAYVDAFARAGYIVFKSDYRGHGKSEG